MKNNVYLQKSGTRSKRSNHKREIIQVKRVGAVIGSLRFPSARPSPGSVTGLACEIYPASHVYIGFRFYHFITS